MDRGEFARAWPVLRTQVKSRWTKLTDEALDGVQGNPDLLIGMIQETYEESRQAIELELKTLVKGTAPVP